MNTLIRPAYYNNYRNAQYCGLSMDDKASIEAVNGDEFYEIDTAKTYIYNEQSGEWVEQPDDTTAVDTGLPPITSETAGHFLANDGSVTHWQSIASKNFVVNLTESNEDGTYTADKTYVQIKAAYDGEENIVVRVNNSELPLMNASFANSDATFIFGFTEARTGGQLVTTRAITYSHIDTTDTWEDADNEADLSQYLLLSGGIMTGNIMLANEPTNDNHPATKKYVDDNTAKCVKLTTANAGTIKAYVQNGAKQDVCLISSSGDGNAIVRYGAQGRITSKLEPTENTQVANKLYVDNQVKTALQLTGGSITGNLDIGGNLTVSGTATVSAMPTSDDSVANKQYVDTKVSAATTGMVNKKAVTIASGKTINIPMTNGVYLVTVCDDKHKGLTCVSVYSSGEDLNDLVTISGWTCNKMPTNTRGITVTNDESTSMILYITSIGEGNYT